MTIVAAGVAGGFRLVNTQREGIRVEVEKSYEHQIRLARCTYRLAAFLGGSWIETDEVELSLWCNATRFQGRKGRRIRQPPKFEHVIAFRIRPVSSWGKFRVIVR